MSLSAEERAEISRRNDEDHAYYRPRSSVVRHLTNECIRASPVDRCDRSPQSDPEKQVEAADRTWERERHRPLNALIRPLRDDPAVAAAGRSKGEREPGAED